MEVLCSPDRLEEFTLGYEFREFIHKIAYRLLNIEKYGSVFLRWYYDHFIKLILSK